MNWIQAISTIIVCGGMSLFFFWYGYILIRGRNSEGAEAMTRSYRYSPTPTAIAVQGVGMIIFGVIFLIPIVGLFV